MSDPLDPPPSPSPVPPPRPVPVGGGRPEAPPGSPPVRVIQRARMPGMVGCLAICGSVLTVLAVGCLGGSAALVASGARQVIARKEADIARIEAKQAERDEAAAQLRDLAVTVESIRRAEYEYPYALPDLAPADPWGHPVAYRRISPDRAELRSIGPDGRHGTSDDTVLSLPQEQ